MFCSEALLQPMLYRSVMAVARSGGELAKTLHCSLIAVARSGGELAKMLHRSLMAVAENWLGHGAVVPHIRVCRKCTHCTFPSRGLGHIGSLVSPARIFGAV